MRVEILVTMMGNEEWGDRPTGFWRPLRKSQCAHGAFSVAEGVSEHSAVNISTMNSKEPMAQKEEK